MVALHKGKYPFQYRCFCSYKNSDSLTLPLSYVGEGQCKAIFR